MSIGPVRVPLTAVGGYGTLVSWRSKGLGDGDVAEVGEYGLVFQYVTPGNCSRARSSWSARSRGQPKARAAWPLRSAAAAPLVKWTYSPQFIRRVYVPPASRGKCSASCPKNLTMTAACPQSRHSG